MAQIGPWQALYPLPDDPALPTWLVLAESPGGELLAGDAGKLLDNMLRAAQLHRSARVYGAVVARDAAAPLAEGLQQAVAAHRPALVLAMGRLAAQSLLQSAEPLGRLRGQVHDWQGVPVLVTYDAAYLLRAQADKARAWADLCQALAVVAAS
jgi:DNA polymerase